MAAKTEAPETDIPIPAVVRRNTLLLALAQAIVGTGMQLVPSLGAVQVVMLTGSSTLSGAATSLLGFARMLVAYPVGRLTDARGRKVGLYLGLWLALAGALITGEATLLKSLWLFGLGMLVFGAGVGASQQLRVAAADMYPTSRRSEGISLVLMGSLLGAGLSPLLVNFAERLSPATGVSALALAWFMVPLLIAPSFGLLFAVRPDPREIALDLEAYYPTLAKTPYISPGQKTVSQNAVARRAGIAAGVAAQGQMAMIMAMTSLALHNHGHAFSLISVSVALHVAGMFAFTWPLGRLSDRLGRKPLILAGLAAAALGALLVGLSSGYWTITLGTFFVGLGWSGAFVGATSIITDVTPAAERGKGVGLLDFWSSLAGVILPLAGGVMVETSGFAMLALFGVLLLAYPALLVWRLKETSPGSYG